jgi:hypothetical protein
MEIDAKIDAKNKNDYLNLVIIKFLGWILILV